jgi:hypothetical protein
LEIKNISKFKKIMLAKLWENFFIS